jgi:hypothetical protein
MLTPKSPIMLIKMMDLTLNWLMGLKKNLNSNLQSTVSNEILLKENLDLKKEIDAEKFFQLLLSKEIDVFISEMFTEFFIGMELEKEILLLNERLKEAELKSKELDDLQEIIYRINSLEEIEKERIQMLIVQSIIQKIDEEYFCLELEILQSYQNFTTNMIHTLEGVKKDDGTLLSLSENSALNNHLAETEIQLLEEFMHEEENRRENERFDHLLNQAKQNKPHSVSKRKPQSELLFSQQKNNQKNQTQSSFHVVIHTEKFKDHQSSALINLLKAYGVTNNAQVQAISERRMKSIQKNDDLRSATMHMIEQRKMERIKIGLVEQQETLAAPNTSLRDKRKREMTKVPSHWKLEKNPLREKREATMQQIKDRRQRRMDSNLPKPLAEKEIRPKN